jgi:antitoxin component of RelBE/YafQ-DinJ toxin-antitoxin module
LDRVKRKFPRRNYTIDDDTVAMATEIATAAGLTMSSLFRLLVRQAYQQKTFTIRQEPQSLSQNLNQSASV